MSSPRLQTVLGDPGLAGLLDRLVYRLERGEPLTGFITLQNTSDREREAVAKLLGRRPSLARSIRVDLDELDAIVRAAQLAEDLRSAVEGLRGPIHDRLAERRTQVRQWEDLWSSAVTRAQRRDGLLEWLQTLQRDGTLRRLAQGDCEVARALLWQAMDVLECLPAENRQLSDLAATVCGSSHALDLGMPICTLVLRALAMLRGEALTGEPLDRRRLWEQFGVVCDQLSAPVVVLNLRCRGATLLERAANLHAEVGEPYRISTRQLLREGNLMQLDTRAVPAILVTENVSVLAHAVERFGPRCPSLICTEGQPRTAACLLIESLSRAGARILYHGDFDWAGIGIANLLHGRYGLQVWRMSADDYLASAVEGPPLVGRRVEANWDDRLSSEMVRRGVAVHEEVMMDSLIEEFARGSWAL